MGNNVNYYEAFVGPFCKKDCLFCNEGGFGKRTFVSLQEFENILDNNTFTKVVLTGGEPLLNKDIIEYIALAHRKDINVSLVTAIVEGLTAEFIQSLVDAGLDELMISLEGPEKIHDTLVQESGAYQNIIQALVLLGNTKKKQLKVIIHTNINKINYKIIPFFTAQILKNFPFIFTYHLQMLEPFGSAIKNKSLLFEKYSTLIAPFFTNTDILIAPEKIKFGRLPLCLVDEKYHSFISPTPEIYEQEDDQMVAGGYSGTQYESQQCKGCSKRDNCDRFFHHYIDMFGDDEIVSIVDS